MPRILINVTQEWVERLQRVLPAAIDTIEGLDVQIVELSATMDPHSWKRMREIHSQLQDLKLNIKSVTVIF